LRHLTVPSNPLPCVRSNAYPTPARVNRGRGQYEAQGHLAIEDCCPESPAEEARADATGAGQQGWVRETASRPAKDQAVARKNSQASRAQRPPCAAGESEGGACGTQGQGATTDCLRSAGVMGTHEELLHSNRPATNWRKALGTTSDRRRDGRGDRDGCRRLPAATAIGRQDG
jgi:hypothetical protein